MILEYTPHSLETGACALRAALVEFFALRAPAIFHYSCRRCRRTGRSVIFHGEDLEVRVMHDHHYPGSAVNPCAATADDVMVQRWTSPASERLSPEA